MQVLIEDAFGGFEALEAVRILTEYESKARPCGGFTVWMADGQEVDYDYNHIKQVWIDGRADTKLADYLNEALDGFSEEREEYRREYYANHD